MRIQWWKLVIVAAFLSGPLWLPIVDSILVRAHAVQTALEPPK